MRRDLAPDPIDVHVGDRVRLCRRRLGLSQAALAHTLGITFQQVQKYESGANRISASKLYRIADALNVPVSAMFEGLPDVGSLAVSAVSEPATVIRSLLDSRGARDLAEAFAAMTPAIQRAFVKLALAVVDPKAVT